MKATTVERVDIGKIIKMGSLHDSKKLSFSEFFFDWIIKVQDKSYCLGSIRWMSSAYDSPSHCKLWSGELSAVGFWHSLVWNFESDDLDFYCLCNMQNPVKSRGKNQFINCFRTSGHMGITFIPTSFHSNWS